MGIWRTKKIADLMQEAGDNQKLKRSIGTPELVALGVGAIIGSGIFVLTGVAAANYAGPALVFSFILSGLAAGLAALVYAEMAAMIPVTGSAYTYAYASLGEIIAWLVGWNLVLEYLVASGAVAVGWSGYITDMLASVGVFLPRALVNSPLSGGLVNLPAILITVVMTGVAIVGTTTSARTNKIIVGVKILVILVFLALGAPRVNTAYWHPFLPFGVTGVVHGAAIIFFAYIGFDAVATAAEEVRDPARELPLGIIGSLALATILYVAVTIVLTGLTPYTNLNTPSPVTTGLMAAGVRGASLIVGTGALAGLTSVLLVNIFAQSRVFMAMGRDGLLPPLFTRVHPRFHTPWLTTLIVGAFVTLIGGFLPVDIIAELANVGTLSAFFVVSVGVMVLRRTQPDLKRPFKVPLMPWTPLLAIAFAVYLFFNLPGLTWIRFGVWVTLGLVVYFAYGRRHSVLAREEESKAVPRPTYRPSPLEMPAPARKPFPFKLPAPELLRMFLPRWRRD
ncbi:amino acid permease [Neomoorella thermoacetica]|uniref:amino acid permease n=1 Tax=Neomoorella thermoacetica TaxID=1525 RepID=UPI0008FB5539|nr:amino acid permease [Moorella thermoacetica]OIQ60512.1 putative amino acid permease YhdG [Moorella thermoacetica]